MLIRVCLIVFTCAVWANGQLFSHPRFAQFPLRAAQKLKERLQEKLNQYRERNTQMICYGKFNKMVVLIRNKKKTEAIMIFKFKFLRNEN